jgi:hypothetical protein
MNIKMKNVYVQIVDTLTGISQTGMIEEPVKENHEIENAIKHFGVVYGEVTWNSDFINEDVSNHPRLLTGCVDGTNKIINVIVL